MATTTITTKTSHRSNGVHLQAPSSLLLHLHLHLLLFLLLRAGIGAAQRTPRPSLVTQFLAPHNVARAAVGLRTLVCGPKLAKYAESYAAQRRRDCALVHSDGPYGENIFCGSSSGGGGWTPAEAVAAWVEERLWYHHFTNSCAPGGDCGHYTQIVWRSTARIGCAIAECFAGRGDFDVCEYDLPGNYDREKPY